MYSNLPVPICQCVMLPLWCHPCLFVCLFYYRLAWFSSCLYGLGFVCLYTNGLPVFNPCIPLTCKFAYCQKKKKHWTKLACLQHLNLDPSPFYCFWPKSCQSQANNGCHSFSKADMLILLFVAQKPLSSSATLSLSQASHGLFHQELISLFINHEWLNWLTSNGNGFICKQSLVSFQYPPLWLLSHPSFIITQTSFSRH